MKIYAIIQARMSSTRLPGKILMELYGKPVIQNIVERVGRCEKINEVVVATSSDVTDDSVATFLQNHNINVFRGDLDNVLSRYYHCAKDYGADCVIRLTGDNALVDSEIIDEAIDIYQKNSIDYLDYKSTLPLGMAVEIFSFDALEKAYMGAENTECLEHVTPYMRENPHVFSIMSYINPSDEDHSNLRFTMDTMEDYEFVSCIYSYFRGNMFNYNDVLEVLSLHPEWILINQNITQKEVTYEGELYKIRSV